MSCVTPSYIRGREGQASRAVLYISANDSSSFNGSVQSDVALFVVAFCSSRSFDLVVVEPEISSKNSAIAHERQQKDTSRGLGLGIGLVQSKLCDWLQSLDVTVTVMQRRQLPEVLRDCILPAVIDSSGIVCHCGLSTVLRRLVLSSSEDQHNSDLSSLLGFRQTSLQAFADNSIWTKLVDSSLSEEIAEIVRMEAQGIQEADLPELVKAMEANLASPVSTFNVDRQERRAAHREVEGAKEEMRDQFVSDYKTQTVVVNKKVYRNAIRAYKRAVSNGEIPSDISFKNSKFFIPLESWKREMDKAEDITQKTDDISADLLALSLTGSSAMSNAEHRVTSEDSGDLNLSVEKSPSSQIVKNAIPVTVTSSKIDHFGNDGQTCSTNLPYTVTEQPVHMQENEVVGQTMCQADTCSSSQNPSDSYLKHMFAEGFCLTITDLALFLPVHIFLCYCKYDEMHSARIPFIMKWYQRMWSLRAVKQTAALCGLKEVCLDGGVEAACVLPDVRKPAPVDHEDGRGKSKKARNRAVKRNLASIFTKIEQTIGLPQHPEHLNTTPIDWSALPDAANPQHGEVPPNRLLKKQQQIENLVTAVMAISQDGDMIVDFCSGGGHVGIVLAYLLPQCNIIMIELNQESLRRAQRRVKELELTNAVLFQSNIDYFHKSFDIGVSLHACGIATDIVIDKCLESGASLVSSPCCYGSICTTDSISYPRSRLFQGIPISLQEMFWVSHAGEQTNWDFENEKYKRGKLSMSVVDEDRSAYMRERNYKVHLFTLAPPSCSPKNNLLVGVSGKHQQRYCQFERKIMTQ